MLSIEVRGVALGYRRVESATGLTFVFVNALTGSGAMWEETIAPALHARGHGTLSFDLPGQVWSPIGPEHALSIEDLIAVTGGIVSAVGPARPVFVGLSIGGLFALRAHLRGLCGASPAAGFVLINTLRRSDARLAWINDAVLRLARTGGGRLLRDVYGPLLFGLDWLDANRAEALTPEPYAAPPAEALELKLLAAGAEADWNVAYERIDVPVVVVTGLQDRVFYNEAHVAELSRRFPDAVRYDVVDAAHLLPVEKPDAVVKACLSIAGRIGGS